MEKYTIAIEEVVSQEFEVDADNAEEAMELAAQRYRNGEYILEPGEVQFKQMAITKPCSKVTAWVEF